jgi:hypothetical protein
VLRDEARYALLEALLGTRERLALLDGLGLDLLIAADFCPALARTPYDDCVRRFLVEHLGLRHIVAGHDVPLGAGRGGNAVTLAALGPALGYGFEEVPALEVDGRVVSRSAIRGCLAAGDVADAAALLGRPYALWGAVVPGERMSEQEAFDEYAGRKGAGKRVALISDAGTPLVSDPGDRIVRAAADAGAATFMTSFNEIAGVPSSANSWLLNDVLRGEWGFKGFVVSDYTSINELIPHGVAANLADAGELALEAGLDMDMLPLALVVVILGGAGSLPGSLIGSFIIGFLFNFGQAFLPELAYFVLFLPMVLVLALRPQGLFGRQLL